MAYRETFEPLKITAHLRVGVVTDEWFPLDGILFYQASRLACGQQQYTKPGGGVIERKHNVSTPLLIINPGQSNWYYACSWAYPRPWWIGEGRDHWNKRFDSQFADAIDFKDRRGKVVIGSGQYKAYHMPIFYRATKTITWYCVGDGRRIAELLSTVTHIGKKAAQGWGRVIRWEIEPIQDDFSIWKEGELMRGIPAEEATGRGLFPLANYGLRPSYYRKKNQALLAMPPPGMK